MDIFFSLSVNFGSFELTADAPWLLSAMALPEVLAKACFCVLLAAAELMVVCWGILEGSVCDDGGGWWCSLVSLGSRATFIEQDNKQDSAEG